jgi:Protein of unknown function (DUF4038)/Putative collagen-binding domain of a collagenase
MNATLRWGFTAALLLEVACSSGGGGGSAGGGGGGGGSGAVDFPLHVSSDDSFLEDNQGHAFLVNGDAAWSLMVELEDNEVEDYLDDRKERGFNTVLINLIERGFGGPANADGALPFVPANDYTAPNAAYFDHAEWVIDQADERGMLVLLAPSYLGINCGSQGWCDQMLDQPVTAMQSYGRFLGNRFADKDNILWVHGGDVDAANFVGVASRVNAIANGIRERAPNQLHTAHCSRGNSALDCYDEPWLDVNTTYSDCDSSRGAVQDDYERNPQMVFFYIEGDYEGEGASLTCLTGQHAWAVLGGSGGHVFGNGPIWYFGAGWENQLGSAGSRAMGHLADLFHSRAWFRLMPDYAGDVLVSGAGSDGLAASTSDGDSILVYVSSARTIMVDLSGLDGTMARGWWFDPSNGSRSEIGLFFSSGVMSFTSPGRRLLVVDDSSAGLPPPGDT